MANNCIKPIGADLESSSLQPKFVLGARGRTKDGYDTTYVALDNGDGPINKNDKVSVNAQFQITAIANPNTPMQSQTGNALFVWPLDRDNVQYGWIQDKNRLDIYIAPN